MLGRDIAMAIVRGDEFAEVGLSFGDIRGLASAKQPRLPQKSEVLGPDICS